MDKIIIGNHKIGRGERVFVVAETGINHNGDLKRAHELIDAAAETGVDCIKFHTHFADAEMLKVDDTVEYINESQYQLIKRMEFSLDHHLELKEHVERKGLLFLSTPFSREAANLLSEVGVQAYKIGSGELTNLPFLGHVANLGKPMIISTGMSNFEEVATTVAFMKSLGVAFVLMQCTSLYPTPPENVHLGMITRYINEFGIQVGFSDHTVGNYMAIAAVTLGVCMVEKHFTISRDWPGPDQKTSIEPDELADLVRGIRSVESALDDQKQVAQEEYELQRLFRESVVTLQAISSGSVITEKMVWVKRPGYGIPASQMQKVISRRVKNDIDANQMVRWEDLE